MVALSDRIVTAPETSLAPDLEAGDTALYEPQRGEVAEVTVVSIDTSTWCVIPFLSDMHVASMGAVPPCSPSCKAWSP